MTAMRDYLVFRLYAPLSSWGDIAVGEVRPSWPYPAKSAILGLLAAAKGLRRDERDEQESLRSGYGVAVRVLAPGTPMRDYHTVQRPKQEWIGKGKSKRLKTYGTRRDELADKDILNCTQSTRDYYSDAICDVAVWAVTEPPPWSLDALKGKLEKPVFCLYLGRKSCPPALPLRPQVVRQAATLRAAFAGAEFPDEELLAPILNDVGQVQVYWDESAESGYTELHRVTRRDDPLDRERWQFLERQECYATETSED